MGEGEREREKGEERDTEIRGGRRKREEGRAGEGRKYGKVSIVG